METKLTLVLIPRSTSYSPGPAAPIPPFRPGYTEYVQASKLIDAIEDGIKILGLDWKTIRLDGSHVQPYRENVAFKRNGLQEISESGANAIAVEIGFGSTGPKPQIEIEKQNGDKTKQDENKIPIVRPGSGIRTVHKIGCKNSEDLARAIHSELVKTIPIPDRGVGAPKNELLDTCKIPICQVRPLFIDGGVDPHYLKFARSRTFIASAIIAGIKKYLSSKNGSKVLVVEKKTQEQKSAEIKNGNGKETLTYNMTIPQSCIPTADKAEAAVKCQI